MPEDTPHASRLRRPAGHTHDRRPRPGAEVGQWLEIGGSILTAAAGVVLLSIACVGFFTRRLSWPRRAWTLVAAAFFIMPPLPGLPELAADAIGLVLGATFVASELSLLPHLARPHPVEKRS